MRMMPGFKGSVSRSGFPIIDIEEFVPASIVRDVRREISKLFARGAKGILIQIPIEDFTTTINKVLEKHPLACAPFEPRLCGYAISHWTGSHVGVMGMTDREPDAQIYGADGKVYQTL